MSHPQRGTVWWIDAHHGGEQYATYADLEKEHVPMRRADTGWIAKDTPDGIHLALSWLPKDAGEKYLARTEQATDFIDVMFIPRAMITEVEFWVKFDDPEDVSP